MSRIGKLPIPIPAGVQISVSGDNVVSVKGKKGELKQAISPNISIEVEENRLLVKRNSDEKTDRALHGLYRSLLANMVKGVSEGFKITQELIGVGYKAVATGQLLDLSLGYSHHIVFELAPEITVTTTAEKGKNPTIVLEGIDRQLVGQVAAKIRSLRPPEPYKGKGVRFMGEVVRKKAGKSASDK
ncbi:MAG: 50S ribosomal protein L6 [Bacteroidetes bacterium]|nr:50S ribosomal protein L6 [Bacteroidota bacterium]